MFSAFNKEFSTLFSVKGDQTNQKYKQAFKILGLEILGEFSTIEQNLAKLLEESAISRYKGPENSIIIDVPGQGDCWLSSFLAPLLGYVVAETDVSGIIKRVRNNLSEIVLSDSVKYEDVFEDGLQGLLEWAEKVKQPKVWGGDTEYEVLTRATGLAIHVLNCESPTMERVRHFLPRCPSGIPEAELWGTSVVVQFGYGHYMAVIPSK